LTDELFDLVGVDVIAIHRISILIAGQVVHVIVLGHGIASIGLAKDACPLSVEELTALGLTDPGVAEVRALEDVTFQARCPLLAVAVDAKRSTDKGTWEHFDVSIAAAGVGAAIFGKMQTMGGAFSSEIMGKITSLSIEARPPLQEILAGGHL
jgi:hypothetical protein